VGRGWERSQEIGETVQLVQEKINVTNDILVKNDSNEEWSIQRAIIRLSV
jgi:hypothetical protein